jgi:hypothetical protein
MRPRGIVEREGRGPRGEPRMEARIEENRISDGVNERELKAARSFHSSRGLQEPQPLRKSM